MKKTLENLSNENLINIILNMAESLSPEQRQKLESMIETYAAENTESETTPPAPRMSQEFVDEKMALVKTLMKEIDEGELYLAAEEYKDYSDGYWNAEWITEYYDNMGVGNSILSIIQFAKDCVEDRRYQEAHFIYEWLWEMSVSTDLEYDDEPTDLGQLAEEGIVCTDMKQLALLTLYTDYQVLTPDKRAEDIYQYFSIYAFKKIHIEEMFHAGRENLTGAEQFWKDWIALLQTKSGETAGRLLEEAILYTKGADGLVEIADKNYATHPSLYLSAMDAYEKKHDYLQIEKMGKNALEKIDVQFKIRSEVALKAAFASSCLMHTDEVRRFCWESFRSDSTVRNFLRLFADREMAEQYGMNGHEVLCNVQRIKEASSKFINNMELRQNHINSYEYYSLAFYMGDFKSVKTASKNPQGSLGWSNSFIRYGIRLFLLYLYEKPLPSRAASRTASYIEFQDEADPNDALSFEKEIIEESRKNKTSIFWNYFQRWKPYFQISLEEKKKYLTWAEKIVYSRADAIVSGQHRNHYGEVAALLAMVAEVKEDFGSPNAKDAVFQKYKRKFPRHSSFQAEMKYYFL